MKLREPSPTLQFAGACLLAAIWHGIWIAGLLSGKPFLGSLGIIWGILFFCIPLLWLYAMLRLAWSERVFILDHPVLFVGSVAVGILPPVAVFAILQFGVL